MACRIASVFMLFFALGVYSGQSSQPEQLEIMLKLISQNRSLDLVPGDSLIVWVITEADSVQSREQLDELQRLSEKSVLNIPFTFSRILADQKTPSESISPHAVIFLNTKIIPLTREVRDWHRRGAVTLTNTPGYMDVGVSIAVQKDSSNQQIIWLNPRALEQAGARYSTDILQLTKTRYARGREL